MDTLTFAMGPVLLDDEGEDLRRRFAIGLSQALKRPVRAIATSSYADVSRMVSEGDAQLAWLPPAVFVRLEERTGVHLLAAVQRACGAEYRSVLFVSASSGVLGPEDLRGVRAAWVDPDSCAGHLFPRLALRARGLDPRTLFAEQRFLGSHGSVVRAVQAGEADVGATFGQLAEGAQALSIAGWFPYAGASGMRPVLVSSAIPADVVCASHKLDADSLDEVREALLAFHEGAGAELVDELFGGRRFVPVRSGEYDPVRAAVG